MPRLGSEVLFECAVRHDIRTTVRENRCRNHLAAVGVFVSQFYISSFSFAVVFRMNKMEWHAGGPHRESPDRGTPNRGSLGREDRIKVSRIDFVYDGSITT